MRSVTSETTQWHQVCLPVMQENRGAMKPVSVAIQKPRFTVDLCVHLETQNAWNR